MALRTFIFMKINTLHICNINCVRNINHYIKLVAKGDAVVCYAEQLDIPKHQNLIQLIDKNPVHFVIENNAHSINTITYEDWIELVNHAEKTFTWK